MSDDAFDKAMKDAATEEKKSKKSAKGKNIPRVRTRKRGRVGGILENLARIFEESNSGWKVRWVYHPAHKPDISHIIERRADGYEEVTVGELGTDLPGLKDSDLVRVGDLVMMKLPAAEMEAIRAENIALAKEQRDMLKQEYYSKMEEEGVRGTSGEIHHASPKGNVFIEERTLEVDREQRTSD